MLVAKSFLGKRLCATAMSGKWSNLRQNADTESWGVADPGVSLVELIAHRQHKLHIDDTQQPRRHGNDNDDSTMIIMTTLLFILFLPTQHFTLYSFTVTLCPCRIWLTSVSCCFIVKISASKNVILRTLMCLPAVSSHSFIHIRLMYRDKTHSIQWIY